MDLWKTGCHRSNGGNHQSQKGPTQSRCRTAYNGPRHRQTCTYHATIQDVQIILTLQTSLCSNPHLLWLGQLVVVVRECQSHDKPQQLDEPKKQHPSIPPNPHLSISTTRFQIPCYRTGSPPPTSQGRVYLEEWIYLRPSLGIWDSF